MDMWQNELKKTISLLLLLLLYIPTESRLKIRIKGNNGHTEAPQKNKKYPPGSCSLHRQVGSSLRYE